MSQVDSVRRYVPALLALALAIFGILFLRYRAGGDSSQGSQASQDAKAYVKNLQLSEVTMQATENFMNQRVVEVQGRIGNTGPRPIRSADVFCLFSGIDGHEIGRERVPIVQSKSNPLKPGEVRPFRLPFDAIPEGWNQAMPKMVIAGITFAQ